VNKSKIQDTEAVTLKILKELSFLTFFYNQNEIAKYAENNQNLILIQGAYWRGILLSFYLLELQIATLSLRSSQVTCFVYFMLFCVLFFAYDLI